MRELEYLTKVLNSESWSSTGGSWNNALERAFCEKFGVKYAVAMNSGTATLHCALAAAGSRNEPRLIANFIGAFSPVTNRSRTPSRRSSSARRSASASDGYGGR